MTTQTKKKGGGSEDWEFCGRVIGQLLSTIEEEGFTHFHIHSFVLFLLLLLLLYHCFISFRQSAEGYKVFTFHTLSNRVERKKRKIRFPTLFSSFWKKDYFNNLFFLPSFIHLDLNRMNESGTINTRAIFPDIRVFNPLFLPPPFVCNNFTQLRKQNKLKENKKG
jgi:hypothetical protein